MITATIAKLRALANDRAATPGEKEAALAGIRRLEARKEATAPASSSSDDQQRLRSELQRIGAEQANAANRARDHYCKEAGRITRQYEQEAEEARKRYEAEAKQARDRYAEEVKRSRDEYDRQHREARAAYRA